MEGESIESSLPDKHMDDSLRRAELLAEGFRLFNRQEFFDCHEVLEELWKQQQEPEKQFTQGIIQIAVGYYHLLRDNKEGALKLLHKGSARLRHFEPTYANVKVSSLLTEVEAALCWLNRAEGNEVFVPKLEFVSDLQ